MHAAISTLYRHINPDILDLQTQETIRRLGHMEPRSIQGLPPVLWHEAEGFLVRDASGNQWIDLTSGIVVANVGHSHPAIKAAIHTAIDNNLLLSYTFPSVNRCELIEKILSLSPLPDAKAILFSAGTEATECAMMLMRLHGCTVNPDKIGILSFLNSFHGRTLAARMATGSPGPKDWVQRETMHHYQIPFPFCPRCPWGKTEYDNCGHLCFGLCLESLSNRGVTPQAIAGIIAEAVPGWATWPLPPDFAAALRQWAKHHDILLTFDEVQSGCGRTGTFFGFEHTGIVPDMITLGKGLTSSLPVSAVIGPKWLMDIPAPGEMSSTHGGNPVCAAAASACLRILEEENLMPSAVQTGEIILDKLKELQYQFPEYFFSIHGKGLFISAHMRNPKNSQPYIEMADAIVEQAVKRGVMMFPTHRGFLKVAPPLCIEPAAALEAVKVIKDCFIELKDSGY